MAVVTAAGVCVRAAPVGGHRKRLAWRSKRGGLVGTPAKPNPESAARRAVLPFLSKGGIKSAWEAPDVPSRRGDPKKTKQRKVGFETKCELVEFPEKDLGPHLDDASWQLPSAMSTEQLQQGASGVSVNGTPGATQRSCAATSLSCPDCWIADTGCGYDLLVQVGRRR